MAISSERATALMLRAVQEKTWADLPAIFASSNSDFMVTEREAHVQSERDWARVATASGFLISNELQRLPAR